MDMAAESVARIPRGVDVVDLVLCPHSSLDIASGAIVFYTPARPNDDLVEVVEAAAVPAVVRWEEGESVAY